MKHAVQKFRILGELGSLVTRLAEAESEIQQAQSLRYEVFYNELSARKKVSNLLTQRDCDEHDQGCDHLLVLDTDKSVTSRPFVAGTQRFLVRSSDDNNQAFYSQNEFDVENLLKRHDNETFMELGRSCILPDYRNRRTMELMWQGTWAYALENKVDVMVGCASFPIGETEDPIIALAPALGLLANHVAVKPEWQVEAIPKDAIFLRDYAAHNSNIKHSMRLLPPLLRGYLRLGAMFSAQAVADREFGTLDVLVILPVRDINPRYIKYYGADAEKLRPAQ